MLKYFMFKKTKNNYKKIIIREKRNKYQNDYKEIYVSKKKNILIYGVESSGKTKEFKKFVKSKNELFKYDTCVINSNDTIADILNNNLNEKIIQEYINSIKDENEKIYFENNIKKQYIKIIILQDYYKNKYILIDDLDKLNGRKLEIVKELIKNSKLTVATAKRPNDINKTIYNHLKKNCFEYQLSSTVAKDATNIMFVMFIMAMLITGQHELAIAVMAGRYALKGLEK